MVIVSDLVGGWSSPAPAFSNRAGEVVPAEWMGSRCPSSNPRPDLVLAAADVCGVNAGAQKRYLRQTPVMVCVGGSLVWFLAQPPHGCAQVRWCRRGHAVVVVGDVVVAVALFNIYWHCLLEECNIRLAHCWRCFGVAQPFCWHRTTARPPL